MPNAHRWLCRLDGWLSLCMEHGFHCLRGPRFKSPHNFVITLGELSYREVSNICRTLAGNKIVDHSDVVGASPVGAAPTTTSSNGDIFRVTDPLCGKSSVTDEFPTQRPVTRSFGVFFDLRLNKRLSKRPRGWWFETPSWPLWRHDNAVTEIKYHDFTHGYISIDPCRGLSSTNFRE